MTPEPAIDVLDCGDGNVTVIGYMPYGYERAKAAGVTGGPTKPIGSTWRVVKQDAMWPKRFGQVVTITDYVDERHQAAMWGAWYEAQLASGARFMIGDRGLTAIDAEAAP